MKDGSTYKMWYTAMDILDMARIGYATSSDGISWTKNPNPVLDVSPGQWDSWGVYSPWVIKASDSDYKMWYAGTPDGLRGDIGLATSINGISWVKKGIVLPVGAMGQPDDWDVSRPTVIREGSSYVMWYTGTRLTDYAMSICMAYSGDGFKWSKYDGNFDGLTDVVLNAGSPSSWDSTIYYPSVMKSGDGYFMWYTGMDQAGHQGIGLANSITGKSWGKLPTNPVLTGTSGAWDELLNAASVIQDRLDFKMWYSARTAVGVWSIGYAVNFMRMGGAMGLIDAPAFTMYYIYPDYQGVKPAGTAPAALSDWLALGMPIGMSTNWQYVTTDTHTSVVAPDGSIVVDPSISVVLGGGLAVNGPVKYYEITAGVTPAYAQVVGGKYYFYSRSTHAAIANTEMDPSVVSTDQDMFIMMAFKDPANGRHVMILYGYGWKGTYAAALMFKTLGRTLILLDDDAYYIYKWTDSNGDLFVDELPLFPVAFGS
jgi:predicted GH43/DUF377 family glycosyl hydrolase